MASSDIGGIDWIRAERDKTAHLTAEYIEEFNFSVRDDFKWLHAHMDDLLSSNQLNLTEVLKTPGKLRGKTPHTTRKDDAQRAPLTDLFQPDLQSAPSPAQSTPFYQKIAKLRVAADSGTPAASADKAHSSHFKSPARHHADSGYHGLTEDEIHTASDDPGSQQYHNTSTKLTDGSKNSRQGPSRNATKAQDKPKTMESESGSPHRSGDPAGQTLKEVDPIRIHEDIPETDLEDHTSSTTLDTVLPRAALQALAKQTGLNFASLPPRESVSAKAAGARTHPKASPPRAEKPLDAFNAQSTTDRFITMHGTARKNDQSRLDTAADNPAVVPSPSRSAPPRSVHVDQHFDNDIDDDDWIAPIHPRPSYESTRLRPKDDEDYGERSASRHVANVAHLSTASGAPGTPRQQSQTALYPNLDHVDAQAQTATPLASPSSRRFQDGPLSASKAKLYSVLKSAKGMFASSAGASAQAKMNGHASPSKTTQSREDLTIPQMPGGFASEPDRNSDLSDQSGPIVVETLKQGHSASPLIESDKRSLESLKVGRKADKELDKAREKERLKAAEQKIKADAVGRANSRRPPHGEMQAHDNAPQTKVAQSTVVASTSRSQSRLAKPTLKQQPPSKPVPVNIRVASQSQRLGSSQPPTSIQNPSHDPTPPPTATRQQTAANRSGATSTRAGATTQPSIAANMKTKTATRKKEQDEKATQRKAEQRLQEQRRAAKLDEDNKQIEQERKLAAQRHAESKQRQEQQRIAQKAKELSDAATAHERERVHALPSSSRPDGQGTLRQLNKPSNAHEAHGQQARLSKRALPQEDESRQGSSLSESPPTPGQALGSKRRKTNDVDEDLKMADRPTTMAPPKRPSNIRKETTLAKVSNGYASAPAGAQHHPQSMFKSIVTAQHHLQHAGKAPQMYPNSAIMQSNARIPFAESSHAHPSSGSQASHEHAVQPAHHSSSAFKTPGRPAQLTKALKSTTAKSSPVYQNGENIALPEIHTDSEDEESDDSETEDANGGAFRVPSWVASPALRDLLTQQQLVDPESVFGPIAPLEMDDVFRNGKNAERLKKFRDRGSSARWVETGDAVTAEEKRKDREARAKVVRDGGWSFNKDV